MGHSLVSAVLRITYRGCDAEHWRADRSIHALNLQPPHLPPTHTHTHPIEDRGARGRRASLLTHPYRHVGAARVPRSSSPRASW